LIVEDHPLFRRGLVRLIESAPGLEVIGQAAGAAEATRLFDARRPDLVVVDLSLVDGDGVTLIRELKRRDESAAFLVVTSYAHNAAAGAALAAGATEVLDKADRADAVLQAILRALDPL
jgi:DNA-binding NarL/FixJ family response regulator